MAAFALLVLLAAPATPVALDWSGIPDGLVRRCKLQGFEATLLQRLVEARFAVVREVPSDGIRLTLSGSEERVRLSGRRGARRGVRELAVPEPCDPTFMLDVVTEAVQVVQELEAPEDTFEPRRPWELGGGVALLLPGAPHPLARVQGELRTVLREPWSAAFGLEVAVGPGAVTVIEPGLSARVDVEAYRGLNVAFALGGELALLAHVFDGGGHADARLALPLTLALSAVGLELAPYLRLRPTEHLDRNGERLFASEVWGVALTAWMHLELP